MDEDEAILNPKIKVKIEHINASNSSVPMPQYLILTRPPVLLIP